MERESNRCAQCGRAGALISDSLGLCGSCLINLSPVFENLIISAHARTREPFGLPRAVPCSEKGIKCLLCGNECFIGPGEAGFCGLRENRDNRLVHKGGGRLSGLVSWYFDPLPTNCVASWICPAGDMEGKKKDTEWTRFSVSPRPEYNHTNLAVFYKSCTFNCLFCQNHHFRLSGTNDAKRSAEQLADAVRENTTCICYFGGDPASQPGHAVSSARLALKSARERGKILRICWETNGSMSPGVLRCAARLSFESFGCIKFDLKTFDDNLHRALTGVGNQRTLKNFRFLASIGKERPEPPFLAASTLMVPGYVESEEVSKISRFIAECDPNIPYSLLAFQPEFAMSDLPATSKKTAEACKAAALGQGLKRVRIGNVHLLT